MADGMTREDEVIRGGEAKRVLDNPIYQESVARVREGILAAMTRSAMGDDKTHNRLVISLQLLDQIEGHLRTVMQTGRMAELQTQDNVVTRLRRMVG